MKIDDTTTATTESKVGASHHHPTYVVTNPASASSSSSSASRFTILPASYPGMAAPAGAEAAAGARGGGVGEDESSSLRKAYILDVNDNKEFQYPDNSIATFKYTLLSFVPVSLFEQ